MDYDIVIATRNRASILEVSIPLMLSQGRRPRRLIVVDSSDDDQAARKSVESVLVGDPIEFEFLRSEPGVTRQRNVGLRRVGSPVVMFPDDDSLWLPGVAEAIMRVYERDEQGVIGAVCGAKSMEAPSEAIATARQVHEVSRADKFRLRIAQRRFQIEHALVPDPFILHGRSRWNVQPPPAWLPQESAVLVEWMTGFRMSFRTEIIRRSGFDEAFRNYGLFEDTEASFQVLKTHLIVGARRAQVFHHRTPGKRADGLMMGARQVLDRAYIVCRHSPPGSPAHRMIPRYSRYKVVQYSLACHEPFGWQRFRGAWRALRSLEAIDRATPGVAVSGAQEPTRDLHSMKTRVCSLSFGFLPWIQKIKLIE